MFIYFYTVITIIMSVDTTLQQHEKKTQATQRITFRLWEFAAGGSFVCFFSFFIAAATTTAAVTAKHFARDIQIKNL